MHAQPDTFFSDATLHSALVPLIIIAAVSLVAFVMYGIDKAKAKRHAWRIKEIVLLGLGFCCGAPGALLGMVVFHHKTKHFYFWVVNFLGLAWQCALVVYLLFF